MKPSNSLTTLLSLMAVAGVGYSSAAATPIEDWQFNEAATTQFTGLANSVGTAGWSANVANAATDGAGSLEFTVSVDDPETIEDESADDIFRVTTLTNPNQSTGKFELAFTYTAATIAGGDATGAGVGFNVRDDSNTDLLNVRLQRQGGTLRLQRRNSTSGINTDLEDFGSDSLSGPLAVRVIFDLDSDTFDVFWEPDGQPERCQTNIPMDAPDLELDKLRMYAITSSDDWGATDSVTVDFLTLSTYTAPPVSPAIENWQFNDDADTSLGTVANEVGSADLGGNADNVNTDGLGNLVFTQGVDENDNVFRNGTLTNPDQTSGRFLLEWVYSSVDLTDGGSTGANVGFGIRDSSGDLPFTVRLQKQNDGLRLQTRVGTTSTTLQIFEDEASNPVTTLSEPLLVQVVFDMDTDTFDVFWQLGDGVGQCASGFSMAMTGAEFDEIRTFGNTNTTAWGADDQVAVDYLILRDLAAPTALELSIVPGPGAGEVTLIWPTTTPANAVLEESTDLGVVDAWEEVLDAPSINGNNYELTLPVGGEDKNFFRLSTP